MGKNKGKVPPAGERQESKAEQGSLTDRWEEASNWNPDDFETHPARQEFLAGQKPIPPREG